MKALLKDSRGQSVVEFAVVLPLLLIVVLGVIEVSYALLDQHVVTKMTREGSNLISRETSLADAVNALKSMSGRPVNFNTNSKVIFSVVRRGATTGTNNYNKDVLYQRYEYGAIAGTSAISTRGAGATARAPSTQATNADGDTNIQVTNLPAGIVAVHGRHALHHRDLHDARIDHAVRQVRRQRAEDALLDCLFLEREPWSCIHSARSISSQRGYALIYMCVVLAVLLIFTGLAVDTGRAYVVQAQLSKAVDGAALAAARNLNSGNPRAEAVTVFRANFPAGYLGTLSSTDPTTDANFFSRRSTRPPASTPSR